MSKYLSLLFLLLSATAGHSQSGLEVVSTVIPPAPPTAIAVGATGLVDILVTIDAEGNVTSADVFKGHPLLKQISQQAALKWKFNKNENSRELRTANLTFSFLPGENLRVIEQSEKKTTLEASAKFFTAFWPEIVTSVVVPELLLLPREEGKIKPEKCELHDELMQVDIVSVFAENGDLIEEVRRDDFPNANTVYREEYDKRGNISYRETKKAEVLYCKTCRAKREEWLKQREIEQHLN